MTTENTLDTAIKRATLSGFTVQQTLQESQFPYRIIGPAVTLSGLHEVLDVIERRTKFDADKAILAPIQRIKELQIQLEEIAGLARCVAETCDDPEFGGPLCVINREIEGVRTGLDDLIGAIDKGVAPLSASKAAISTNDATAGAPPADDTEKPARLNEALYECSAQLDQLASILFVACEADRTAGMPEGDIEAVMVTVEREAKRLGERIEDVADKVRKLEDRP